MTLAELRDNYRSHITPQECECLVAHICHKPQTYLVTHPDMRINTVARLRLAYLVRLRAKGVPLAYLTGEKEFYGRSFMVTKHTLIPRPESELIIDLIKKAAPSDTSSTHTIYLDIGTGSGNLISTLACETTSVAQPFTHFIATDISRRALHVARRNFTRLCPMRTLTTYTCDLLACPELHHMIECLSKKDTRQTHLIITANLPYVDEQQQRNLYKKPESQGLRFEPPHALWSHDAGCGHYLKLLPQLQQLQRTVPTVNITIYYEIDDAQAQRLSAKMRACFPDGQLSIQCDLAGKQRVIMQTLKPRREKADNHRNEKDDFKYRPKEKTYNGSHCGP